MESQVRDYTSADYEAVKRLHEASGIDYQLPDLSSPLFIVTKVVERDGEIIHAAGARIETELYLWSSHSAGTPEERWEDLQKLNGAVMKAAWLAGIDECVAWIPKNVEKHFAKRLDELGFSPDRDGWHSYSRKTNN